MRKQDQNRADCSPFSDQDQQTDAPSISSDVNHPLGSKAPHSCLPHNDREESQRNFPGQRWVNIGLRGVHLLGVSGIGGGFLLGAERPLWEVYWWLTLISGIMLSLLYLWATPRWVLQLKGMAIIAKVVLLAMGMFMTEWRAAVFTLVLLISAFIAHAPGRVRGYEIGAGRASS